MPSDSDENQLASATSDFIFGSLANDELRLASLKARTRELWHGNRIAPVDPIPGQAVTVTVTVGTDITAEGIRCYLTTDGTMPSAVSPSVAFEQAGVAWDTLAWGYTESWATTIPPQPEGTLVRYRIAATLADGTAIWADQDEDTGAPGLFVFSVDRHEPPAWAREAVIYHIFIDRFAPDPGAGWWQSDDLAGFWGGTLRGLIAHLDHIADLGATAIWLSPIFPSPTHHGYDATDYHTIEPRLGTEDDLRELIAEADVRGMRVLLDFVASHVSSEHPRFLAARGDPDATERSWFTFRADGTYRSFFGVESMPQLATNDRGAANYLIDAARHWLEMGIAGFRLDYAVGPSHAFWARLAMAVRETRPDAVLLGEVVEDAESMASYEGRLDGTLDFLLLQQLRAFLAFDVIDARDFGRFLTRHLAWFGDRLLLPSFLDNHDMNRFLWAVQGDRRRLRLAALLQVALPHPPIVYYGTEVGLSQGRDLEYPDGSRRPEESRTPMPWGDAQDRELRGWYTDLIAARRAFGPHRATSVTALPTTTADVLAVAIEGEGVAFRVALNRSETAIEIPLSDLGGAREIAVATESGVNVTGEALHLPPMAGAWLT